MILRLWVRISTAKGAGSGSNVFSREAKVVITGATWSWVLAAAAFCGYIGVLPPRAEALTPSALNALQDLPAPTPAQPSVQSPAGAKAPTSTKKTPGSKATTEKKPAASTSKSHYVNTHKRRPVSPRVRRMRQAFVASASLRPMAQQLLQDRSLPAYSGVQAYARAHAKEDAGALALLVLAYAHVLDRDYAKAIDPLSRAKIHAGDLGDYVAYYLGISYLQTGHNAEALANLADFAKTHPDSLLVRDAQVSYADALLLEGQAGEAATLLETTRVPTRSDVEFALGRAYAASGQTAKAAETLANIYYTMPGAAEADAAFAELKKLPSAPSPTITQLRTRAEGLISRKRYAEAADEYRSLANTVSLDDLPRIYLALADALHRSGKNRDAKQVLTSLGNVTGELNAQRLYLLGQVAWAAN